jgi:pimeloyl-ACP methyl ester carboxylesterase
MEHERRAMAPAARPGMITPPDAPMRRRLMIWFAVLACAYVLLVLLVALLQDRLVFPAAGRGPWPLDPDPARREFRLATAEGSSFRVVEAAAAAPRAVLVFFVGNGEDLRSAAAWCTLLAGYGLHAVAPEYPGYGGSDGAPSEASLYAAATATAAYARTVAERLRVPLFAGGSSLGSFCATWVAGREPVQKLVLRAPPTTLVAAAQQRFPWLPVRLFLRHRFDNLANSRGVHCPVLIAVGSADRTAPPAMATELAAAFVPPARLVIVPGFGHDDLTLAAEGPLGAELAAFLRWP